jgi:hypothetical protein
MRLAVRRGKFLIRERRGMVKRILRSFLLTTLALIACVDTASATKISVQAQQVTGVFFPGVSAANPPKIRIFYNKSFTENINHVLIPGGAPNGQGATNVYLEVLTTWSAGVVSVPGFTLDSTDDALDDLTATCSFFWFGSQNQLFGPVAGMNSLVIYHHQASTIGCSPQGTCAFWVDLRVSNQGHIIPSNPTATYSTVEIDRKIAAVLVSATGFPDPGSNGILARSSPNVATPRSIVAGSSNVVITNGNGVSGNPSIDLGSNVVETASLPLLISANNISLTGTYVNSFNSRTGIVTLSSGDVTTALSFIPENPANKNASNGYAGLSSGKIALSQITKVMGTTDLSDATGASGTGSTILKGTFTAPVVGQVPTWTGTDWTPQTPTGLGTVTSVGLSTNASYLTIGSSPVTGAGTITVNKTTGLTGNQFVGTPDGTTGTAELRAIVNGDLPTVNRAHGGTNLTAGLSANQVLGENGAATGYEGKTLVAGSGMTIVHGASSITFTATVPAHTILSHSDATVAAIVRGDSLTVQGTGTPTWSRLPKGSQFQVMQANATDVVYDAVHLNQAAAVTGQLPAFNGGTGLDGSVAANGALAIGNGTGFSLNTITAGSNITITNTAGNIQIDASGTLGAQWSNLTSPGADLSLSMSTFKTTFTQGARADAADDWTIKDSTGNTGTGHLLVVNTVGTSTMKPLMVSTQGTSNGIEMNTSGVLAPIGTGGITANALNGVSGNGIQVRTSAGNFTSRTDTAGAGLSITNGDGVAGNPTFTWAPATQVASFTVFDSSQASRTITYGLSAGSPVLTLSNGAFNISTGTLQQGGTAVVLQSRTLTAGAGINPIGDLSLDRTISVDQNFTPTWTGVHTFSPTARASGTTAYFSINIPADTGITTGTEAIGFKTVTATRTWAGTTTLNTQRENVFAAPTYSFVGTTSVGTVATLAITGAPIAGSNVSGGAFGNAYALWVQGTGDRSFFGASDWLTALRFGPTSSRLTVMQNQGKVGLTTASRASDQASATGSTAGLYSFAINDNTSFARSTYGTYTEASHYNGLPNSATTIGHEVDILNYNPTPVTIQPYAMIPSQFNACLWVASGGGDATTKTAGVAIGIINNQANFQRGIVFQSTAIAGTDGVTGTGIAIEMAKGHQVKWTNSDGTNRATLFDDSFTLSGSGVINGGAATGSTLTLKGTSNGSPSSAHVLLNPSGGGNVGIGVASPAFLLDVQKAQNTDTIIQILNSSNGTIADALLQCSNGTKVGQFGETGTGYSAFGALTANNAFMYTSGALTLMANDATAGVIKFATGGSAETMKLTTGGDLSLDTQGKGVVLRDTDGAGCHRLTINTAGVVATTSVTCP